MIQYVNYSDSTDIVNGHGTHISGTIAGRRSDDGKTETDGLVDGVAPDAKIAFFDLALKDQIHLPGSMKSLLDPGMRAGARIHSASWGVPDYMYSGVDRDIDRYIYSGNDDLLFVTAAGNYGPSNGTIASPGLAKNVLAGKLLKCN